MKSWTDYKGYLGWIEFFSRTSELLLARRRKLQWKFTIIIIYRAMSINHDGINYMFLYFVEEVSIEF